MKKILIIIGIFIGFSQISYAQYGESIRTGRPGQSVGAFSVGSKTLQLQTGLTYGYYKDEENDFENQYLSETAILRYGLNELFEISTVWQYTYNGLNDIDLGEGISASQLGLRFHITDGDGGFLPITAFQYRIRLNALSSDFKASHISSKALLAFVYKLSSKLTLISNLGLAWNGNNSTPKGVYTLSLNFPITDKIGGFVESYGQLVNNDLDTGIDTGIGYLINNHLQLDISAGINTIEKDLKDYFIDLGVSWRFPLDKERRQNK